MKSNVFSLNEILSIARIHPFYAVEVEYPPDTRTVQTALNLAATEKSASDLCSLPLTTKKQLYKTIERLTGDSSPNNIYRQSSYISITGGGSGGLPMMFATDAMENQGQRARMGAFLRSCGIIGPSDWILTTHVAGNFYRSLDLTLEILENAGASVLGAGHDMSPDEVVRALAHFHVNVLSGDGSQVVRIVRHISTLPLEQRRQMKLNKIIYTSEPLTPAQRAYITDTLGSVELCSILGSSEAGPWAVGNPALTGEQQVPGANDFVFDTRTMLIEILVASTLDGDSGAGGEPVPDGSPGIIVQTSLQRLKNPLVRYVSGDVGSLHHLPEAAYAVFAEGELKYLRVLRLHGRDRRFSFKWCGSYFEFGNLSSFMQDMKWGILQWQVVLDSLESSPQLTLEVRILPSPAKDLLAPESGFMKAIDTFFFVQEDNRPLFKVNFL